MVSGYKLGAGNRRAMASYPHKKGTSGLFSTGCPVGGADVTESRGSVVTGTAARLAEGREPLHRLGADSHWPQGL